jgi:hypothetical protein
MFVLAALLFAASHVVGSDGISLGREARTYLEGRWAVLPSQPVGDPCVGARQTDAEWELYRFWFTDKKGAFRITDNVDADWKGRITRAELSGDAIHLVLADSAGNYFKDMYLVRADRNHMQLRETIGGIAHAPLNRETAYRCLKANRPN